MSRLKPYDSYKRVQYDYVAELPDGWQLLPNIAVFEERIERGFVDEELLSVTIGRGVIRQTDVDIKKDSSNEDKSKYKLIQVGDIAYNKMRMWQGALGYSKYQGISSPAYVILKPKMKINPKFFHYMFRTGFYTNYSKRISYGIVDDQLSLRYVDFKRMYSIVPPLDTQNAIVAYLDRKTQQIQAFIQKKERLIELLEEEKSQTILSLSTKGLNKNVDFRDSNINWLGEIPNHWIIKKLKYVCDIEYGISTQLDGRFKTGTPIISLPNVSFFGELNVDKTDFYQLSKKEEARFLLKKDDLLFNWRNGSPDHVGKTALFNLDGDYTHVSFLLRLRFNPNKFSNRYFRHFINGLRLAGFFNSARQKINMTFNKTELGNFIIAEPPISEQLEIAKEIDARILIINSGIEVIKKELLQIREYQESLITQVVTGQLRVPALTHEKVMN